MSKKHNKFVKISGKVENTFLFPGRQKCECAASKHELVNNCVSCGRIVCAQEGSGPCWFCGALVCTEKESISMKNESNNALQLRQKLMNQTWSHQKEFIATDTSNSFDENSNETKIAQERKERLLEYDRNSTQRTKVIDDQSDYYRSEGTSWIDPKKKELLKKKEEELRAQRFAPAHTKSSKYTLDLKSGTMIKEADSNEAAFALFEDPNLIPDEYQYNEVKRETNVDSDFLEYIGSNKKSKAVPTLNGKEERPKHVNRIQDKELQEIRDEGMCLSLHQPWASLLVCGVKTVEGRPWFSNHKGRLWIASAAKVPTPELIEEMQIFYFKRGVDARMFPKGYPVGCIVGCVDVVECLPEDDYKEMYPGGESDSPFIFVCENPQELSLKFPVKGKHKIYKLESHIHNAAKGGIRRGI